ncbi:MAG: glycosyl hydrolase [Lewinellaceae bacterium]|nr:glycosyl hydrolase [Lewinellaceae bacterium]
MKQTKNICLLALVLLSGALNRSLAQHPNVLISAENAPNEPAICINPKNTQEMVAGANLNNVYYSHDGGVSWTKTPVSCPWGIWGDPVIGVDTSGAFYYLHLSNPPSGNWIDRIIAQKSTDGGVTWSAGSYMGLNGAKAQDKHWIAVDRQTNALYVTWTQFDNYGSTSPADSSVILFSRSTDAGETWSPALRISQLAGDCIDDDNTTEGAVPCIGPNGEIYTAWSNRDKLWFDRSTDKGENWLAEDIFVADQPGGWAYDIAGIYRANGLPVTACDLSGGPHHGAIYVNWSDQRNGAGDTDIWLAKSNDGGNTWSEPRRVNDDGPGKQQFFTWMTVDQVTGWLWFTFYDRRHYPDNRTDVYMALSQDGGETFTNFKVSESPFSPTDSYFFGDYTNVAAHNNVVRPIWTRLEGNNLSIWTALIQTGLINSTPKEPERRSLLLEDPFPNPFSKEVGISFKLHRRSLVRLSVMDLQGREMARPIDDEWWDYGKYLERIDMQGFGLPPGVYFLLLSVDGEVEMRKVVREY